jgi:hypothetical protein
MQKLSLLSWADTLFSSVRWLVKRLHIDVPALYDPRGRYRYNVTGINPRAFIAFFTAVGPLLPGLAYSINPTGTHISQGTKNLYTFDWLFGFVTSIFLYTTLSYIWKPKDQLIEKTIFGIPQNPEDEERYAEQYDEKVLAKGSLVQNPKSFSNIDGIDDIGAALHTRRSSHEIARISEEHRRASRAEHGGQGPKDDHNLATVLSVTEPVAPGAELTMSEKEAMIYNKET